MGALTRHLPIALHLLRTSIGAQTQYRSDFILQIFLSVFWVSWNIAPVWLIFEIRPEIGGWDRPQAMLVMSGFLMLRALIEGLVGPNLNTLVQHVRMGTLDFLLLKPIDPQLLASVSKVVPSKMIDFMGGFALSVWAYNRIDPRPDAGSLIYGTLMLVSGSLTIYSIWLLIACTAFWFVKIDNLTFLFSSIFDAARWPITVFRGWVRTVLTFVIPVALMTSYPALALLGRLDLAHALIAWGIAVALLIISRLVWVVAIRRYSSASS